MSDRTSLRAKGGSEPRVCEWCGEPLAPDAPATKVTCSDSHRALRWRFLNDVNRSGGRPPQSPPAGSLLSRRLSELRPAFPPERAKRAKPSGLQVSYRKAVDIVAEQLQRHQVVDPPSKARLVAELWLRPALSDRQRKRLEDRDAD